MASAAPIGMAAALAAAAPLDAPRRLQRFGESDRICQLTGETDWLTGRPTGAKTLSSFGLDATDLGSPAGHDGKLILLFEDSWPTRLQSRESADKRASRLRRGDPGPAPTGLLGPADNAFCRLLMSPGGCGGRRDYRPQLRQQGRGVAGGFYAPFVLGRYAEAAGDATEKRAVIYWLVSTWNPYQVVVLRTMIGRMTR